MTDDVPRPHRPALFSDLTEMIDAAGGHSPERRAEVAASTAAVLVETGRSEHPGSQDEQRFVALADHVGIDTLAALWRDSDPVSLPGALWALYLLRQWCRSAPEEVVRFWRAGEQLAPAEAAVAGVADYAGAEDIRALPDAVLAGVYRGDLSVALERAAGFFRVVAVGRRSTSPDDDSEDAVRARARAERNDRAADALTACASRWRAGHLH